MGRYISGDWDWKFAFGDQSSSFGQVMQNICAELDCDDVSFNRYVGTEGQGEKVELIVENARKFKKACQKFIGNKFKQQNKKQMKAWCKCEKKFSDEWDKMMISKFLKDKELEINSAETINLYIEY